MLIGPDALELRRRAVAPGAPLAPLFDSLAAELEPWLTRPLYIPAEKALLSRVGGRCETDGTALEFDPATPHAHRCPTCARVHEGDSHHRAWVMPYQLWLAERALQGALFHLLRGDARHASFARTVLTDLAARYHSYPNVDNVLGPSRLFFSTYLESVWLLQVCLAANFLELAGVEGPADTVRDRIANPARQMIAGFNEGRSNREVWNNAALIAAAVLCGDDAAVMDRAHGAAGVTAHLEHGILADGSWYEGENYHQFALRGLWYGVTLLEGQGIELEAALLRRFERAFTIPVVTALPDFTMPSRKDSQYAVSLRQWRMAELLELGMARRQDPILLGALARCYESGLPRVDTGRSRSTADIERNSAPGALSRADLGWRALLYARVELPPLRHREPRSALLKQQGYVAFRREHATYVGFECGQSGGGHGHADRLNLTLYQGGDRWLDDLGTGSYVDPSLHWFRSTLAHNAPLVNGKSQPLRDAVLVAHDEREGLGWVVAALELPDGVRLERAVVVAPDYLIDELRWTAAIPVRVELPWHLPLIVPVDSVPTTIDGGGDADDGFSYLRDARRIGVAHTHSVTTAHGALSLHMRGDGPVELFTATGPGQPPSTPRQQVLARMTGVTGMLRSVLAWSRASVELAAESITIGVEAEEHRHRRDDRGWHVELNAGGGRSSIDLSGTVAAAGQSMGQPPRRVPPQPLRIHRVLHSFAWLSELHGPAADHLLCWDLGETHYRRSEIDWRAAGEPTARVALSATEDALFVHVVVRAGDPVFAPVDARNDFDNEHPDTMAAGVQLHVRAADGTSAWTLVPEAGGPDVRVRSSGTSGGSGARSRVPPMAWWQSIPGGYEMRIEMPAPVSPGVPFSLDALVNETTRHRVRRRGQLVLSGAAGEFVYLRGDRQDEAQFIPLVIVP